MKIKNLITIILISFFAFFINGCNKEELNIQQPSKNDVLTDFKKENPDLVLISWDEMAPLGITTEQIINALEKKGVKESSFNRINFSSKTEIYFFDKDQSKTQKEYIQYGDGSIKADAQLILHYPKNKEKTETPISVDFVYFSAKEEPRNKVIMDVLFQEITKGNSNILENLIQDNINKIANNKSNNKTILTRKEFDNYIVQHNTVVENTGYTQRTTTFSIMKKK